jgi:Holliday junction DNA helicase RuvA
MIAKLKGTIDFMRDSYAVVDVNGVGYKVFLSAYSFGKIAGKTSVEIFTHTYVREDILALYGFLNLEELEMFELLISISGIGPKAAMGILSIADPKTIKMAVINEDPAILTKVSGVGKKIAQRVILELKNKIEDMSTSQSEREEVISDSDSLEALVALGYSITQAREALKLVPKEISDVSERVKTAMKNMGRR